MPKLHQKWECVFCHEIFTEEDKAKEHESLHSEPRSFIGSVYPLKSNNWAPSMITILMSDGTVYEYYRRGELARNE